MINFIKLCRFKSHESSELTFAPGLTCIVGTSAHGKTNVLRAFRWVFEGRPLGDRIRKEKDGTEVIIGMNGHEIRKTRIKGENVYYLDGEKFEAFGKEIPEEIRDLINFGELNVQRQFSPHFLVLDAPGKVAEWLNKVTGLGEVEGWIDGLSSRIRKSKGKSDLLQEAIEELKAKLANPEFSCLEQYGILLNKYEKHEEERKELAEGTIRLDGILASCNDVRIKLEPLERIDLQRDKFEDIRRKFEKAKDKWVKSGSDKLQLGYLLCSLKDIKTEMEFIDVEDMGMAVDKAVELGGRCERLDNDIDGLGDILDGLEDCRKGIDKENASMKLHKRELEKLYGEVRSCPVCESPLDDRKRRLVVERMM